MALPLSNKETSPDDFAEHWIKNDTGKKQLQDPRHIRRFDIITEITKDYDIRTAYDIGCATGETTVELHKRIRGQWAGIDFSQKMIKEAHARHYRNLHISWTFVPNGKLISEMFMPLDLVVCSEVIEHIKEPQGLINDCLALADQLVIFTTPCKLVSSKYHVNLYTSEQLVKMTGGEVFEFGDFFYVKVKRNADPEM